ncbi:MAG: ABC transporter substrate-binding protein [Acetobacteraceae bacterium]
MKRRIFLQAGATTLAAAALARPHISQAAGTRILRYIPQADLAVLDPVWTTAYVTRNHGLMVFDTLFGVDASFNPQPQMVSGVDTSADGKTWTLTLRDGLKFHDGTPVLARDCVASVQRWGKRDSFGQALMAVTDELSAPDDKTLVFKLKQPFPLLPSALGKISTNFCPIMPERLAKTDAFTQVTEMVGSGPYRFLASERVPGARLVYERFDGYVPRPAGSPDWLTGPKIANFDRVEWTVIPDATTAVAALQTGQQDWWEQPTFDLLPVLKKDPNMKLEVLDPSGSPSMLRFNHLFPPFDNPAIRRAILGAVDQSDFMTAVAGTDPGGWRDGVGYFPPGSPLASDVGMKVFEGPRDYEKVKKDLAAAGYKGEKAVVMVASDFPVLNAMGMVGADMLQKAGIAVDLQVTDWGSIVQRRASKKPPSEGGWNVFFTSFNGIDQYTPAGHLGLRGNGANGWFGWCNDPKLEELRAAWFAAPDTAAQKAIGREIQARAFDTVPYIPIGEYFQPTAYNKSLSGIVKGCPIFWGVKKAA